MGQVLYRKYRSKKLSEIVGQEHITKTLDQALSSGRISHAYLFTGPRGIGKTSIARIMAHEINQLPYDSDRPNIDIIEIDAASNRRIDEIRDLRDKVHILPTSAKYKVYIIDEVHMLTKEAFNALLKTLEEPPAHVVFILATTDAHKLPDTIISRTQRFNFKPVEKSLVIGHLKEIAKTEKIAISDEALDIIAEHGEGSFRDSISLLDQLSNANDEISAEQVLDMLGIPSNSAIDQIINQLEGNQATVAQLNSQLVGLYDQGYSAPVIAKALMNEIRTKLVNNNLSLPKEETLELLKELIEVEVSADPSSYLQIVLLGQLKEGPKQAPAAPTPKPQPSAEPVKINEPLVAQKSDPDPEIEKDEAKKPTGKKIEVDDSLWPEVLNVLKKQYNTLYGIVRMAQPEFKEDHQLDLIFDFAFHQKRVNDTKNKQIIAGIIMDLTGENYQIECHLNSTGKKTKKDFNFEPAEDTKPANKDLDNISKIFGGGEVID